MSYSELFPPYTLMGLFSASTITPIPMYILDVSYLLYLSLGKFLKVTDDTFLFLLSPLPSIGQCRKTIFFNLQTLLIFNDLILYSDRVAFLFTTTHHIRIIFRDISYNENYNIVIIGTARFFIAFT